MPRTVAPNGCEKPIIAIVIFFRKNVFPGFGHLFKYPEKITSVTRM
jgi:hypothetical protein